MELNYERLIQDVCLVFHEVTGSPADPKRDAAAIMHWARLGWQIYDFRLLIEFQFLNEAASAYFKVPGRMNLRQFFNPSRGEVLLDIHCDLKARDTTQRKKEESRGSSPDRERKLLMRCGEKIYRADYSAHHDRCFEMRGACFFG